MKWRILMMMMMVMTLTIESSLGITKFTKIGSQEEITCHTSEGDQPEFCSFTRPDGFILCQVGTEHDDRIPENCFSDKNVGDIQIGADFCKLPLLQVSSEQLGSWQCMSLSWDVEESKSIILEEVTDAKVELLNLWGVAHLETGIEQTFQCSLISEQNLNPLQWQLTYPNQATESLGAPQLVYDDEEEVFVSSISFTPQVAHQNAEIKCWSKETGEFDRFEMDLVKFKELENSFLPYTAQEGQAMNKTYKFSSFPAPKQDNIKWILNLPTNTINLNPGNIMDHFTATNIQPIGRDVYRVDLLIDQVSLDMSEKEHTLFIKISETKEVKIDFKIDVEPLEEIVVVDDEDQVFDVEVETGGSNSTVNGTVIGVPRVETENVSLFIIIGIIILCLILCILFYSAKCCNKEKKKEELLDEENPTVVNEAQTDEKEQEPLLAGKTQENGQVNPPPLFNEEEYIVQLCGDDEKSSIPPSAQLENDDEKHDLENKLETLRNLTSASQVEDERPSESKLKRVPTLPKNHPSHQDDHDQLKEKARQLQSLSHKTSSDEDDKEKKDEKEKKPESDGKVTPQKKILSRKASVDIVKEKVIDFNSEDSRDETDDKKTKISTIQIKVENKLVENRGDPHEEQPVKKDEGLTRDWKLSPIWKKSIDGLNSGSEDSSPVDFHQVEMKLKLETSISKQTEISYTTLKDDKDSSSEDESVTVIPNTNDDDRPLIDEDSSTDDETANKSQTSEPLTSPLLVLSKTPVKPSRASKERKVSTSTPKEITGVTQKPPQSPKSAGEKKSSKFSSSREPILSETNDNPKTVTLTRKESCDAGTQTPKIRARSVDLYFGGSSSSGSEQSLNKEEISEKLIKETQQLKNEVEKLKRKLEEPGNGNDDVFIQNGQH